jgi:two-component system, NtrC family, nitrogen regulation response regulator GlnG
MGIASQVSRSQCGETSMVWLHAYDPDSSLLKERFSRGLQDAGFNVGFGLAEPGAVLILFIASPFQVPHDLGVKAHSRPIFCCGPQIQQWPLEIRCRLLRSGVKRFLDTTDPLFAKRLFEHTRAAADDYQAHTREREELQSMMRALGLIGRSAAFLALLRTVVRVGPLSDIPVLITGETGTGKELFAQAIHRWDPERSKRPLVAVNCAAFSSNLLESELFGYRRGAFTGADRDRAGLLRSAEGSVLFLDEIGELPLELQAKFLRALQSGEFTPVGEDRASRVNVRIVAATNQPLETLVSTGKFREDLYHRLNVVRLRIPPLRERKEDIAPLVRHFFERYKRAGVEAIESDILEALEHARFPGNVRQLENIIRCAMANKAEPSALSLADCPPEIWEELEGAAHENRAADEANWAETLLERHDGNLTAALQECERVMIEIVLAKRRGNQSETARDLGITPRSVYNKLRKHGLTA